MMDIEKEFVEHVNETVNNMVSTYGEEVGKEIAVIIPCPNQIALNDIKGICLGNVTLDQMSKEEAEKIGFSYENAVFYRVVGTLLE